ncbi:hypothetical protein LOTGIDRAFT_101181, partial [Lottia gigantea]
LHDAISQGNEQEVQRLLQNGADVNALYNRELPFTRAVDLCNNRIAEILIGHKDFNPNSKNQLDRTPIFYAAKYDRLSMVQKLKSFGCETDASDIRGVTPLGATSWDDAARSADFLIQNGADVNKIDFKGESPLHRACSNVSIEVIKLLLNHGCCVNSQTKDQKLSPLMMSIPSSYELDVRGKPLTKMIDIVKLLLTKNCDLNLKDKNGRTALHHAVDSNEFHSACLFMEHGCGLDIPDNEGLTPFHLAITLTDNNTSVLESILKSKIIDINSPLKDKSPLTLATERGHIECAVLLLQHGADATELDPNGQNSLHVAASKGKAELLQILMINQDVNCRNAENKTPLWLAAAEGQFDCAILLCMNGADPSLMGDIRVPALHFAAGSGQVKAAESFLQHGAEVTALDGNGNTALHVAASRG